MNLAASHLLDTVEVTSRMRVKYITSHRKDMRKQEGSENSLRFRKVSIRIYSKIVRQTFERVLNTVKF